MKPESPTGANFKEVAVNDGLQRTNSWGGPNLGVTMITFLILFVTEGECSHAMKPEFHHVLDIVADTATVSYPLRDWCKEYSNV